MGILVYNNRSATIFCKLIQSNSHISYNNFANLIICTDIILCKHSGSITSSWIRGLLHTQILQKAKNKRWQKRKRRRGSKGRPTIGFSLQRKSKGFKTN